MMLFYFNRLMDSGFTGLIDNGLTGLTIYRLLICQILSGSEQQWPLFQIHCSLRRKSREAATGGDQRSSLR